jgi:2-polyprenyl-3-methyl-5-hydroxy-6-metoxy-1,4-benzoquinol methylase
MGRAKTERQMNQQDPFADLKTRQREMWASFTPTAIFTTPVAGQLVKFAGIGPEQNILDVGPGTDVVAITAARAGARVTGLDLTPPLLDQARENARIAQMPQIVWTEGDAENLPSRDTLILVFVISMRRIISTLEMIRRTPPASVLPSPARLWRPSRSGLPPPAAATRRSHDCL